MKQALWKRIISVLMVSAMILTGFPAGSPAVGKAAAKLVNIAAETTVSTYDNSTLWNNSPDFIKDGSVDTGTAALFGGYISAFKAATAGAQAPYDLPYIQMDFGGDKENIKKIHVETLKTDDGVAGDTVKYDCVVWGKDSTNTAWRQLGSGLLRRAAAQADSGYDLVLDTPVTVNAILVTLDLADGVADCWPILREIEIYQNQEETQEPDPGPASGLVNVSKDCTIAVPSEQSGKPASNMTDGNPSTMWVNNGGEWPCTVEFALPAANTKCVKKVVLKFENQTNRTMDVSLKYAINNVTSDMIAVEGSEKRTQLSAGYEYVFETPQAMSHLYVTLATPLTGGAAGAFWPAIAEAEIYVDNGAEEEVILENLAKTVALQAGVNTDANKAKITDGDDATAAPLHTKTLAEIQTEAELPYIETHFGVNQRIRQFVLAMKQDSTGAQYRYTIYGKRKGAASYTEVTSGTIGTGASDRKVELAVSEFANGAKEVEYADIKVVFAAGNDAAKATIPYVADFQALANKAGIVQADGDNIVWKTEDIHASSNQNTVDRIVDGNKNNTWSAKQYPAYVDIGLDGEYSLDEIEVYMPQAGYSQYSLYYSNDGQNYSKLAEKTSKTSCPADGEKYPADGVKASSVRILLEYHSVNEKAVLNEIRVRGTRTGDAKETAFKAPAPYQGSAYDQPITEEDTIEEVKGIISRNIGDAYTDWFTFALGAQADYDYYEIEDTADGKIRITGNDGVSLASGLNHYLKYYCNVLITQVGNQVQMPEAVVPVGQKIHKECKVANRYAYNYCTMSYSMPFWGENEWRKELDWLALNGVNLVLDITGQEEVWRQFLGALGYDHQQIKDFIAGPAFYAWAYMANLSGYGGPVHDSWFAQRTELARKNQLIMRKLGMQPVLQGYSGMVPTDVASVAKGEYALSGNDVIAQGNWGSAFQRPYMLRTTNAVYKKYAALFYECQKNVFGDVTDYYATDPFHEGGNEGGMNTSDMSRTVVESMIESDADAVWVIQSWQGNPTNGLLNGLEGKREHALVLDLYAEKTPHWNETNAGYYGGGNFGGTPFVYCMLNNFGGRMGLHGHMDNLVSGVVDAANNSPVMEGIGITPEASQNNPVLYDLLFETVWSDDASQPLTKIDTAEWLKKYTRRRYGAESENAYEAMRILENTVYKASLNMLGQGAPESFVNARPAESITAASTWGNAVISYDMAELERAASLLLKDYDQLKDSDGYQYDLADILKQILSNSAQKYHREMVSALQAGDLEAFTETSDTFLALIDEVEKVLGTRKEFLLGTWVEQAKALAEGADDFSKDLYEFNAKSIITTWGSYQHSVGGLMDYSNRQWAGLTKDVYKQRWTIWIEKKKTQLQTGTAQNVAMKDWFEFGWEWARANTEYTTEPSGLNLKTLGKEVLSKYSSASPASKDTDDYPVEKVTLKQIGSEQADKSNQAVNVLDGDTSTFWHTNWTGNVDNQSYANHYLVFELAEETEIAGMRYLPRQDNSTNGIITGYEIYVSSNGTDYTLAASGSWASDKSWKLASFAQPQKAKYVKLVTTASVGGFFSSAAEIRITLPPVLAESIEVQADRTELKTGDTVQLSAVVLPENTSNPAVVWSSSKPEVASVDEDGLVTAVSEGTAVICAEAEDGGGAKGEITLTIVKNTEKEDAAKAELQKLLAELEGKQEKDYSAESWSVYAAALKEAQQVLADPNADLTSIYNILGSLKKAVEGLDGVSGLEPVPNPNDGLPKVGSIYKTKKLIFKVTASSTTGKKVAVTGAVNKKAKKVKIPATVKIADYVYQVTEIAPKAFRKSKKLTTVVIGKNIQKIGGQAFAGCKKLKKVTVKTKLLKTVGKKAFQGVGKKVKIAVPKKKYKAYAKLLKKAKTPKYVKVK